MKAALLLAALASAHPHFEPMDVFELEWASDPQISPDGTRVLYVRNSMDIMEDRSRSELWIVNCDGTDHRRLSGGSSPRWSPDGSRLAYIEDGQIHLRWMDSGASATLTKLTESPSGIAWSLDGKQIAFSMLVREDPPRLATAPKKPEGGEVGRSAAGHHARSQPGRWCGLPRPRLPSPLRDTRRGRHAAPGDVGSVPSSGRAGLVARRKSARFFRGTATRTGSTSSETRRFTRCPSPMEPSGP